MKQSEEQKLIEHILSAVEDSLEERDQTNDFIESLREQFNERGSLSERQVDALTKFYDRID